MSKSSEARSRIINTASDLFYRNGYNSTGVNEVIREAGVAKATLYAHFRSKDELCLAYLQHRHAEFINAIEEHCRNQPAGIDQLLGLFVFLEGFFNTKSFCGCWAQRTIAELPLEGGILRDEILAEKAQLIQLVNNLLVENFPSVSEDILVSSGRKIYLLYEGAVGESYLQNDEWPIRDAHDMCQHLLHNL